jgi:hypothetical protein
MEISEEQFLDLKSLIYAKANALRRHAGDISNISSEILFFKLESDYEFARSCEKLHVIAPRLLILHQRDKALKYFGKFLDRMEIKMAPQISIKFFKKTFEIISHYEKREHSSAFKEQYDRWLWYKHRDQIPITKDELMTGLRLGLTVDDLLIRATSNERKNEFFNACFDAAEIESAASIALQLEGTAKASALAMVSNTYNQQEKKAEAHFYATECLKESLFSKVGPSDKLMIISYFDEDFQNELRNKGILKD